MATKKFATAFDIINSKDFAQTFDQDVTFKRKGKEIKIKDFVQENAVGTDFYENLEKFGNKETVLEFMNVNRAELVGDFTEAQSLVSLEERRNKTKEIWNRMPAEIRGQFDNKFQNFMDNGQEFFDKQAKILAMQKQIYEQQKQQQQQQQQQQPKQGEKK